MLDGNVVNRLSVDASFAQFSTIYCCHEKSNVKKEKEVV